MNRVAIAVAVAALLLTLSSCGQANRSEDNQANTVSGVTGMGGAPGEVQETQIDEALEKLAGEYEYLSDDGSGKLIIEKTSSGYDISDYESESSYRFLADSSNIEAIENNRIYIKYPEQVFSDDTAIFSFYILEYSTEGISVYYGESGPEEVQFLYLAAKK